MTTRTTHQCQYPAEVSPEIDSSGGLKTSVAFLETAIWTLLAGAVATVIAQRIVAPDQIERSLAPLLVFIFSLLSWYLLSRDKIVAAKYVLVSAVWLVVAVAAIFTGGVVAPIGMTYPAIIISTAWLLSARAAWVLTALTIICTLGTGAAQQWALLPTSWPSSTVMYVGDQIVIYLLSATLAAFLVRSYRSRVDELNIVSSALRKQALDLDQSKAELQRAQSVAKVGSWIYDLIADQMKLSAETCRIFGLPEGTCVSHDSYLTRVHPDDRLLVESAWNAALKGAALDSEHRILVGQSVQWVRQQAKFEFAPDGTVISAEGTTQDISDRKQASLELAISKSRYEGILQNSLEAYWRADGKGRIVEVNKAICEMHGYSKDELLRMSISDFEVLESTEDTRKHIETIMREGHDIFESRHRCRDGRIIDLEINATRASDRPDCVDAFHRDTTERKALEHQVRELAFHDPLTKLPNRRLLNDRLAQTTTANKRSGSYSALIFLDLDNFKSLNDEHGHGAGDLLLVEVASRLRGCVREVDSVSRLGGDEFVVLLGDLTMDQAHATEQSNKLAEKIRVALAQPYLLAGGVESKTIEHHCSASIGLVLFSKEHQDLENLLKWADAAMYRSKAEGRNRITFMVERRKQQRA